MHDVLLGEKKCANLVTKEHTKSICVQPEATIDATWSRTSALVQLAIWAATLVWVTFGAPMVCSTLCNMRSPEREGSPHLRGRARTPSDGMLSLRLGGSGGGAHGAMHEERERLLPAPSLLTAAPAPRRAAPIPVKAARAAYGTGTGAIV